ncbi:hypothetical protein KCV07_g3760, partial [Aureobasidium melanogenum]
MDDIDFDASMAICTPSPNDVVQALTHLRLNNLPRDDDDVKLLCEAAEDPSLHTMMQDLFSDLRPEDFETSQHENPGVEAVREAMWMLVADEKRGCHVKKSTALHIGFNQLAWLRQTQHVKGLEGYNEDANQEVYKALGRLDNMADPRTGSPHPAEFRDPVPFNRKGEADMFKILVISAANRQAKLFRAEMEGHGDAEMQIFLEPMKAILAIAAHLQGKPSDQIVNHVQALLDSKPNWRVVGYRHVARERDRKRKHTETDGDEAERGAKHRNIG